MTDVLAVSIVGLRARENLRDLSYRDPLTNLHNRRCFFEVLSRGTKRAQRYGHQFALAFWTWTTFARSTICSGICGAIRCSKGLPTSFYKPLRLCDYVFRYGGDEFLLLFPDTDEAGAVEAVRRVRAKPRAWSEALKLGPVLDFSVGISVYDPKKRSTP